MFRAELMIPRHHLLIVNSGFYLLHYLGRNGLHTVLYSSVFGDLGHHLIFVFTPSDKATIHSGGAAFHYFRHSLSPSAWIVPRFALSLQVPFHFAESDPYLTP